MNHYSVLAQAVEFARLHSAEWYGDRAVVVSVEDGFNVYTGTAADALPEGATVSYDTFADMG